MDAEEIGELIVAVRDHVHQKMRRCTKGEPNDRISDCATDCSADGRVGCERHNAGMIAQNRILGQVLEYIVANIREEKNSFALLGVKTRPEKGCLWLA